MTARMPPPELDLGGAMPARSADASAAAAVSSRGLRCVSSSGLTALVCGLRLVARGATGTDAAFCSRWSVALSAARFDGAGFIELAVAEAFAGITLGASAVTVGGLTEAAASAGVRPAFEVTGAVGTARGGFAVALMSGLAVGGSDSVDALTSRSASCSSSAACFMTVRSWAAGAGTSSSLEAGKKLPELAWLGRDGGSAGDGGRSEAAATSSNAEVSPARALTSCPITALDSSSSLMNFTPMPDGCVSVASSLCRRHTTRPTP
jgi:hypothetical protein